VEVEHVLEGPAAGDDPRRVEEELGQLVRRELLRERPTAARLDVGDHRPHELAVEDERRHGGRERADVRRRVDSDVPQYVLEVVPQRVLLVPVGVDPGAVVRGLEEPDVRRVDEVVLRVQDDVAVRAQVLGYQELEHLLALPADHAGDPRHVRGAQHPDPRPQLAVLGEEGVPLAAGHASRRVVQDDDLPAQGLRQEPSHRPGLQPQQRELRLEHHADEVEAGLHQGVVINRLSMSIVLVRSPAHSAVLPPRKMLQDRWLIATSSCSR
jgi:hypothetical protein